MPLRHHTPMTSHLLMIEDDTRLARMVGEYLGQSGFVCAHAANGGDGLALLQDEHSAAPPQLVIPLQKIQMRWNLNAIFLYLPHWKM